MENSSKIIDGRQFGSLLWGIPLLQYYTAVHDSTQIKKMELSCTPKDKICKEFIIQEIN